MKTIEILGPGCANCEKLEQMVRQIVDEKGIQAEVVKISDFKDIAKRGVLSTPGLVIDGEVKCTGRVPEKDELENWIS